MLDHPTASLPVVSDDIHSQFMAALARAAQVDVTVPLIDSLSPEDFVKDCDLSIDAGSDEQDLALEMWDAELEACA